MNDERTKPKVVAEEDSTHGIFNKPPKEDAIRTVAIMSAILATRIPIEEDGSGFRDRIPDLQHNSGPGRVVALALVLYEEAVTQVDMYEALYTPPHEPLEG